MAAGVPLITPEAALSERPPGKAPVEMLHEYGGCPPEACIVKLYDTPAVAPGKEAGVVTVSPTAIERLNCFCAVTLFASVTVAVKVKLPVAEGVPASTPVGASSVRPFGRDPEVTDQA